MSMAPLTKGDPKFTKLYHYIYNIFAQKNTVDDKIGNFIVEYIGELRLYILKGLEQGVKVELE
jgi:hypothetical protein